MRSENSLAADPSVPVECRKKTSRIAVEALAVTVISFVFVGLAWGLLAGQPVLRIVCVAVLIAAAAVLFIILAKNRPCLVLANKTLRVWCHEIGVNGELGKAKEMVAPLERLDRIWVGRARDYPSGLLLNRADSKTFPWATTMVIWFKGEDHPYLLREFSWLSATEEFLKQLRAYGIRVECAS